MLQVTRHSRPYQAGGISKKPNLFKRVNFPNIYGEADCCNKVLFAGPQVLLLQTYMHLEVWILSLSELQPIAEFCRSAGWWGVTNKTRQTNTESVMEFLPLLVLCSQVAERRGPQHSYAGAPGEVKFPLDGSIWGALYIPSESTQILLFKKKPDFFNHYRNRDWNRAPKRNGWSFPARSW